MSENRPTVSRITTYDKARMQLSEMLRRLLEGWRITGPSEIGETKDKNGQVIELRIRLALRRRDTPGEDL